MKDSRGTMQYQEFLDQIYQRYSGNVKLELGRMEGLLKDMGSPEKRLGGFHVAGTNGKGSVCATLEALCLAHGLKTGLNTSPHLINYTERFRIGGQEVPFALILDKFNKYEELFNKWEASFFEITTAIAFALFAEAGLDLAVMEVGLGGRLDATNLFTPDVAAITTIALDHIKTLGGTVEIIAGEKAGIIKEQIPLVLGDIEASPLSIIQSVAKSRKAPMYLYDQAWQVKTVSDSTAGICFDYQFKDYHYAGLKANLMGEHQAINLGQALTAFILYCEKRGIKPDQDKVREALVNINWMGRMQVLGLSPTVIIDGAHNVHGVRALMGSLDKVYPDRKLVFVLSILADKDYSEMIHLICSKAEKVYVAQNTSDRAATAEAQKEAVEKHHVQAIVADSVAEAFSAAYQEAGPNSVIVAGGSLFTVGEVISAFRKYV
ncbi:MAG: bifunctional folylpolyglutamate synthase/dihydrofolate synthase [Candidatus Cloacimonetes bacterium]|nr:bifunctional folylpolyglutamate synthase/dihydrofolate synthase [Candidatus Cloacimonadota bacterium]